MSFWLTECRGTVVLLTMILVKPSYIIRTPINPIELLKRIESAGRVCYKSEERITDTSAEPFIKSIIQRGHTSVIEHESISVKMICDRGVSHELVRHRLASYSQESTRYCNYGKQDHVSFIVPPWIEVELGEVNSNDYIRDNSGRNDWIEAMLYAESTYIRLLSRGWKPEQARDVLPNSLKTEIVMTCNLREWREVFRQRALSGAAHPQMRESMIPIYTELRKTLPIIFEMGEPDPLKKYD